MRVEVFCLGCGRQFKTTDLEPDDDVLFAPCPRCGHGWAQKVKNV